MMNMKTAAGVLIYSIEGNIGAGKSTLLHELERLHAARGGAEGCGFALRVLAEPVDEWCKPVLPGGESMLQAYYRGSEGAAASAALRAEGEGQAEGASMSRSTSTSRSRSRSTRDALAFQMFAMLTRVQQVEQAVREATDAADGGAPRPCIIATERGPWSGAELFGRPMHAAGLLSDAEWHTYMSWFTHTNAWTPAGMVYLRSTPEVSAARVRERARQGEETIDLAYLTMLHVTHDSCAQLRVAVAAAAAAAEAVATRRQPGRPGQRAGPRGGDARFFRRLRPQDKSSLICTCWRSLHTLFLGWCVHV
jgi:deoxyadenosine/deoxycytidine kinase